MRAHFLGCVLFYFFKLIFCCSTNWADPVIGQFFKWSPWRYSRLCVSFIWIVYIPANNASILCHFFKPDFCFFLDVGWSCFRSGTSFYFVVVGIGHWLFISKDFSFNHLTDEDGVVEKFGVSPASIPDYLALVGDDADGFPGLPGWGAKSSATLLARYRHIEDIPLDAADWDVSVRGAERLAATLAEGIDRAILFRKLAKLQGNAPVSPSVEELEWSGPTDRFPEVCQMLQHRVHRHCLSIPWWRCYHNQTLVLTEELSTLLLLPLR